MEPSTRPTDREHLQEAFDRLKSARRGLRSYRDLDEALADPLTSRVVHAFARALAGRERFQDHTPSTLLARRWFPKSNRWMTTKHPGPLVPPTPEKEP